MKRKLLLLALGAVALAANAFNQLPADPAVRVGRLDNGLTYYIRHNDWPRNRADFYIAQRVGSVNEDDNQRGLAHFLEHMCFNGTEHFPGNSLISYLETLGVKFGQNLNAYTSTDETVYNICDVPTGRASSLDSCLLVLRDWSRGLTLNGDDIDAERGVIEGEWRQRQGNPFNRMLERAAPRIFDGSKYGHRLPIGTMDVVLNFKHNTLRDYYNKWYYPDNQCVIVVGDVNPDSIEAEIKRLWSNVARPAHNPVPEAQQVPDNSRIIAVAERDPEQSVPMIQLYVKHDELPDSAVNTILELRRDLTAELVSAMLAERFDILEGNPEAPFSNTGIGDMKFILANARKALLVRTNARPTREAETVNLIATELKRAAEHGFTDGELKRAKLDYRSQLDREFTGRDKITNTQYAKKYVRHYLDGGALPSAEQYYKMMKGVLGQVGLPEVNAYVAQVVRPDDSNVVVVAYLPENDRVTVTEQQLADAWTTVDRAGLQPHVDNVVTGDFEQQLPAPGTIAAVTELPQFGAQQWTLGNGIKVFVKQTDNNPDQVLIQAFSPGGISQTYDKALGADYRLANDVLAISGYGPYSSSDIRRMLVGKNVKTSVSIENMEERLAASASPADLETTMQLLRLKATDMRRDDNAFKSLIANQRIKLASQNTNPTFAMGDSIHYHVYNRHPLGEKLKLSDLDNVDYDRLLALHADRFGDMTDFSFFIVGNFNPDTLSQLVCKYIATLPANGRIETPRDIDYRFTPATFKKRFTQPMTTPQSIDYTFYHAPCQYNLENVVTGHILGQMIQNKLRQVIREEKGWTYGVKSHIGLSAGMNGQDGPELIMPVYIKVAPENAQATFDCVADIVAGFADVANVDPAELQKVKSFVLKSQQQADTDNGYWLTVMHMYDKFGRDMHNGHDDIVNALTPQKIADFARTYLLPAHRIQLEMSPSDK